jgi:hypothetical protein
MHADAPVRVSRPLGGPVNTTPQDESAVGIIGRLKVRSNLGDTLKDAGSFNRDRWLIVNRFSRMSFSFYPTAFARFSVGNLAKLLDLGVLAPSCSSGLG